jgi:hypothetical protein
MFAALVSAFNVALGWVFRSILVRFGVYFALYFVTTEFVSVVQTWLPDGSAVSGAFGALPPSIWYFLSVFAVPQGISLIVPAYITRFAIRRIPLLG